MTTRFADLILGPINSMPGLKNLEDEKYDISTLLNAYRRGEEIRVQELIVGNPHNGAMNALRAEFLDGTCEFEFALAGYCANLPEKVEVDEHNTITNIIW